MEDQKPWEDDDSLEEVLQVEHKPEPMPKYEVVKSFSFGKQTVLPGDEVPEGVSEKAMASLLRKGVLKTL